MATLRRARPDLPRLARRLADAAARRPVLAVFLLALGARVAVAAGIVLAIDGAAIPDESQYLYIADLAANDLLTPLTWSGYGRSMFAETAGFMVPLTFVFKILWPWRFFGQVLAAIAGAGTAAVTARLGLAAHGSRGALVAGGIVALLPSQILWSSVVLRESLIWLPIAGAALIAWHAMRSTSASRLALLGLAAAGCVFLLGNLRDQTAIPVAWALPLTALVARPRRRLLVPAGALVVALLAPMAAGIGVGGYEMLEAAVPALGKRRAELSINADSAFVPTPRATTTTVPQGTGGDGPTGAPTTSLASTTTTVPVIQNPVDGSVYIVENSVGANFRAIPRGLVATMLRPFPWEPGGDIGLLFARVENFGWYLAYALALVGLWFGRARRHLFTFPVIVSIEILTIAALTQGNLGTAFRHRGQVLWSVALLAATGALGLLERRTRGLPAEAPVDVRVIEADAVHAPASAG